ncbi:hypothetical protein CCR96_00940 [Halochromatium roseum]|nr:hypothetical protein [Halochromatium roseum]
MQGERPFLDADECLADDATGAEALLEATRGPATRIGLLPVISAVDLEDQVAHSTSWLPRLLLEMPHWQPSPDFFIVLGDLLLDWALAHPAQAEQEFLPLVESAVVRIVDLIHGCGLYSDCSLTASRLPLAAFRGTSLILDVGARLAKDGPRP